ncbi:MAG: hypothetical protein QM739_00625 [Propionivibrio sp.]
MFLLHYPLGTLPPTVAFSAVALLVWYRVDSLFLLLPALLPLVGFAPWTGWITFEELDLLVLAAATGGYARLAFDAKQGRSSRVSFLMLALAVLFSISVLVSMVRGFADAGGFVFGWFQGYDGPMNSIRIGKSFFLALLLLPLLIQQQNRSVSDTRVGEQLSVGMALGLATASLAALWERLAFTDLLNFSSDYRTTALFWEMHVGGAALDGWLLLTFPFAIWFFRKSRSHVQLGFSIALLMLAAYAALTTFSRGVYLALALSLPLLAWQTRHVPERDENHAGGHRWALSRWVTAVLLLGGVTYVLFPSGGYRALLAMLGIVTVSLPMLHILRRMVPAQMLVAVLAGLCVGGGLSVLSDLVRRGPYVLYTFLLLLTFACVYWSRKGSNKNVETACLAGIVGLVVSAAGIAEHWGGRDGLFAMCGAILLLVSILLLGRRSKRPLWPNDLRWQGSFLAVAVSVCAVISVFAGGAYMGNRFATSAGDFENRISHWRHGMSMLRSNGRLALGKRAGAIPGKLLFCGSERRVSRNLSHRRRGWKCVHVIGQLEASDQLRKHPADFAATRFRCERTVRRHVEGQGRDSHGSAL